MELSLTGENLFIIDSDHLDQVQAGLYGYFLGELEQELRELNDKLGERQE